MNFRKITLSTVLCVLIFISSSSLAQKKELKYEVGTSATVSSKSTLPFWLVSNKNGIVPDENNGLISYKLFTTTKDKKGLNVDFGATLIGSHGNDTKVHLSEFYGTLDWKFIEAHVGIKNREVRYDGLSAVNGDLLFTNNARSYPEIRLGSKDFITLKGLENIISVKGSFANGVMLDKRYVDNTNVHHKNIFFKLGAYKGFSLIFGMDHYAQWGGKSQKWGNMGGFSSFIDAVFIQNGKVLVDENGNSSQTESMNKGGNHIGQNVMEVHYENNQFQVVSYFKSIFEDSSGYGHNLHEVRDWNLGFFLKLKKGKLISSFMYEHFYSKHQSDEVINPLNTFEPVIGYDNYFNNGVYRSGWTSYGRTIGNPLFTPNSKSNGMTLGIANNAIKAHHLGVAGSISGFSYRLKATFSKNYGKAYLTHDGKGPNPENYSRTYTVDPAAKQQSYSLEIDFPKLKKLPFDISVGMAYDKGDHLPDNNWGGFISLVKKGIF
jgi:hypothetical protein